MPKVSRSETRAAAKPGSFASKSLPERVLIAVLMAGIMFLAVVFALTIISSVVEPPPEEVTGQILDKVVEEFHG